MQDEHGDAMEANEWVHKSSRRWCKVNACISFYVAKWLLRKHLDQTYGLQMQLGRFGPSIYSSQGVLSDKTTFLWMFVFWTTCMQGKNGMRRKFFVATLTLSLRPRLGFAKVQAKSEAWGSHFMLPGVWENVREWTSTIPSELPLWEL
jgi:hypothetical protein